MIYSIFGEFWVPWELSELLVAWQHGVDDPLYWEHHDTGEALSLALYSLETDRIDEIAGLPAQVRNGLRTFIDRSPDRERAMRDAGSAVTDVTEMSRHITAFFGHLVLAHGLHAELFPVFEESSLHEASDDDLMRFYRRHVELHRGPPPSTFVVNDQWPS